MGEGKEFGMKGMPASGMGHGGICPICGLPHCGGEGHSHVTCPACGMSIGYHAGPSYAGGGYGHGKVMKKAAKNLLIEKVKQKMEARWGDKFDEAAETLVDFFEEKKKSKVEAWKRKSEMLERLREILTEDMEEEE